ncbi:MAG: hypothetical protein BGO82_07770 [Devosia sp. 67-54]|mgnify:CR=1 FL=1|uniref:DUF6602 domain-containing protein n=1 Tax=unclassified Devosia TaxID=196773 RepID=UPI00095B7710|nr:MULTISPECIES: DUF6602 domain-containing protein [unclassified Devosia]MBN9307215.1 hypothetical protein [Devosia sp.]OJX19609.1 MAG: hypothetical protein BGO82_07770 [Devosia sp. 67-54]
MSDWSLQTLLAALHDDIEERRSRARKVFSHPTVKGDASEGVWRDLLSSYLPKRYEVATAHVVDSEGTFSDQIDVVVFDRQYSPFVFHYEGQAIIPAESVYAVFEAKQSLNAGQVEYAHKKVASVRVLHRTSLPIPTANGLAPAKPLHRIVGGLLTFDSDWKPALGDPFAAALAMGDETSKLDIGCCAAAGTFWHDDVGALVMTEGGKPATGFLLELIARLQGLATVPMIDVRAYAAWLAK